jgi:hypothetical protein
MIRHVRLSDDGSITHDNWPEFAFYDYSVSNLRTEVAAHQDDENITLCVRRAGPRNPTYHGPAS